jgi:hypothetical protein
MRTAMRSPFIQGQLMNSHRSPRECLGEQVGLVSARQQLHGLLQIEAHRGSPFRRASSLRLTAISMFLFARVIGPLPKSTTTPPREASSVQEPFQPWPQLFEL